MEINSIIQVFIVFVAVLFLHLRWAKRRVRQWASSKLYRVTKCQWRFWGIGPFSYFGTSGGQTIFRIEVTDYEGEVRTGYARVGGYFFGLLRSRVEVKWDRR